MNESEWQNVWEQQTGQADEFYARIDPELEALSRKKSMGLTQKIIRNSSWELGITILMMIGVPLMHPYGTAQFWVLTMSLLVIGGTASYLYVRLHEQLRKITQADLLTALTKKVEVIQTFIRMLYLYLYVFLPLSFVVGLISGMLGDASPPEGAAWWIAIGSSTLIFTPILLLTIWLSKRFYIRWLYGQYLEELETILRSLTQTEADWG